MAMNLKTSPSLTSMSPNSLKGIVSESSQRLSAWRLAGIQRSLFQLPSRHLPS